jgi:adenylate cyclase
MANQASTGASGATAELPTRDEVAAELQRILGSRCFEQAGRSSEFLRYVVEQTLDGNADRLKGYTIAVEVFGRPGDFDAQTDPLVRVEAGRLRRRLVEYYADEGAANPIRISLPRGRYAPEFAASGSGSVASNGSEAATGDALGDAVGVSSPAADAHRTRTRWRRTGVAIAAAGAILALAILAFQQVRHTHDADIDAARAVRAAQLELPAGPRVLVLPFENLSNDSRLDYFADGITEEVMLLLGTFDLFVIPSRTSWYYRDAGLPPAAASVEAGANYVLTGTVRNLEERVRITARLVAAQTNVQLWATALEKNLNVESLIAIEESIAREVAETIAVPYGPIFQNELTRAKHTPAEHLDTYDCVLKYYYYRRTVDPALHGEAVECFELAVAREPQFANAWAGLALLYLDEHGFGYTPQDTPRPALARAFEAARDALDMDGDNYLANLAMARARYFSGDLDGFQRSANRVRALEPNNAEALALIGAYFALSGRTASALPLIDKAAALSPEPIGPHQIGYAIAALAEGRATDALQAALRIDAPNWFIAPLLVAAAAAHAGEPEVAARAIAQLDELYPAFADHADEELAKWQLDPHLHGLLVRGLRDAGMPIP